MKKLFLLLSITSLFFALTLTANAQKMKRPSKAVVNQKGSLAIEAGLIYRSGDAKPVARTEFHLLDADLETILKDSKIESETQVDLSSVKAGSIGALLGAASGVDSPATRNIPKKTLSYSESYALWSVSPLVYEEKLLQANALIKPHIITTITTDFSGKGTFSQVKAGNYHLIGTFRIDRQSAFWNLSVDIKAGSQSIVLDNKNTAKVL